MNCYSTRYFIRIIVKIDEAKCTLFPFTMLMMINERKRDNCATVDSQHNAFYLFLDMVR